MPQTFADSLNQFPIYADRAEKDELGRNIVCTYATKDEVVGDVLPDMTGNAGKVLAVNQSETAAEWTSVPSPAGKADKVAGAVAGDLAALDCEGNLVDSGIDSSDVAVYPSFTNNAGKVLAVNAGETGVEWVNQSGGGGVPSTSLGASYSFHTDTGISYPLSVNNMFANAVVQQNIYNSPFTSTTLENCIKGTDYLKPGYLYHFDMDLGVTVKKDTSAISGTIKFQVKSGTTVIATARSEYASELTNAFVHCEFYVPDNINNAVIDIQFTDLSGLVLDWYPAVTLIATKNVASSGGGSSLPSYTVSDHGKCLKVNSAGNDVEWATDENTEYTGGNMISVNSTNHTVAVSTTAGITDIQIVNALPASPVATVLYLIPVS